jgi:hypothetical protein
MGGASGGRRGIARVAEPHLSGAFMGIPGVFFVLALVLGAAGVGRVGSVFTSRSARSSPVVLSSRVPEFALDNANQPARPTGEPAAMTLLGVALTSLGVLARRLQQGKLRLPGSATRVREGRLSLRGVDPGNSTPSAGLCMKTPSHDLREFAG